jgi:uncharacterized FlaG/YvyC family protein
MMDMEMALYTAQELIKDVEGKMKEIEHYANFKYEKDREEHIKIIARINADLKKLYDKLEF